MAADAYYLVGNRHTLEPLEAKREPVPIRAVLDAAWQVDGPAVEPLQRFQHRAIFLTEKPLRHMNLRQWDAVPNHRKAAGRAKAAARGGTQSRLFAYDAKLPLKPKVLNNLLHVLNERAGVRSVNVAAYVHLDKKVACGT